MICLTAKSNRRDLLKGWELGADEQGHRQQVEPEHEDETATERASFYAYARRGRPEASAQVSRDVEVREQEVPVGP